MPSACKLSIRNFYVTPKQFNYRNTAACDTGLAQSLQYLICEQHGNSMALNPGFPFRIFFYSFGNLCYCRVSCKKSISGGKWETGTFPACAIVRNLWLFALCSIIVCSSNCFTSIYRNPTTGGWRAVKIAGEVLHPPEGGWSDIVYVVVTPPVKVTGSLIYVRKFCILVPIVT